MLGFGGTKKLEKLCETAHQHYEMGDFETAEKQVREGLALAERAGDKGRSFILTLRSILTGILRQTDRLDEAIEEERRTLQLAPSLLEGDDWQMNWHIGGLHNNLGQMLAHADRFDEAVEHFTHAIKIKQEALDKGCEEAETDSLKGYFESSERTEIADSIGVSYADLIDAHYACDEPLLVDRIASHAVEFAQKECTGKMCAYIADALLRSEKFEAAEELLTEARKRFIDALNQPEDQFAVLDPDRAIFEFFYKKEYKETGRVPRDLLRLELKLALVRHHLGIEPFDLDSLPKCGESAAKIAEENPVSEAAERDRFAVELHEAARMLNQRDVFDAAEREYRAALAVYIEHLPGDHPAVLQLKEYLNELLRDTNRPEEF